MARSCSVSHVSMERTMAILLKFSESFGNSPTGIFTPGATCLTSKSGGVHLPSLRSKLSTWLAPPCRKTNKQYSAVPRSRTFSFTVAFSGRSMGSRSKPEIATAPTVNRLRRVSVGISGSQIDISLLIIQYEFRFINQGPEQVFAALGVMLGQQLFSERRFFRRRGTRQRGQKQLFDNLFVGLRRLGSQQRAQPAAFGVHLEFFLQQHAVEQHRRL